MAARNSRKPVGVFEDDYFKQKEGIATLQYPYEQIPVPDNGRYQLDNEIDDCIVCDKCAKVCPVNCIDIEPVRATEEIGKTSDGTSKRIYAAKFDIDMAKCCFCGLCTTVCPTECLTMTSEYDFSTFDITDHNFVFGNMSEKEVAEKKRLFEEFTAEKLKQKEAQVTKLSKTTGVDDEKPKPVVKRKLTFKPKIQAKPKDSDTEEAKPKKVVFKPKFKPKK